MKKFDYQIKDLLGIHARPAGMLVKEAGKYESTITLKKGAQKVDANKLMAIMAMGVKCKDTVTVEADGADETAAIEGVKAFFLKNL